MPPQFSAGLYGNDTMPSIPGPNPYGRAVLRNTLITVAKKTIISICPESATPTLRPELHQSRLQMA